MSYHLAGLGADPPDTSLPTDVAPTLVSEVTKPVDRQRGWVAVPTYDMRQYVQTQLVTFAAGFVVGMGIGAVFGNVLAGKKLPFVGKIAKNRRRRRRTRRNSRRRQSPRRTSTRRRRRGRPAGAPVDASLRVTIDGISIPVEVKRGKVSFRDRSVGFVYDLGTKFQAVPFGRPGRSYGTLAGAVKHVVRTAERAA